MKHLFPIILGSLLVLLALAPAIGAVPGLSGLWTSALVTGVLSIGGLILLAATRNAEGKPSPVRIRFQDRDPKKPH